MKCDCGKDLVIGNFLTKLGNEIEYMECKDCGLVEVNDMEVDNEGQEND